MNRPPQADSYDGNGMLEPVFHAGNPGPMRTCAGVSDAARAWYMCDRQSDPE